MNEPYSQGRENGTDTNQASEDELRASIDKALHIDWAFNKSKPTRIIIDGSATKGAYHTSYDLFVDNMIELIITEKLKLLAEVRERVVGEDERIDIQSDYDKLDVPYLEMDKYPGLDGVRQASRNLCRNRQRAEIDKLEAEL